MNYFELYDIPVCFHVNKEKVKATFYALSKKYHPDRYMSAPPEETHTALDMAALNNAAYKTLSQPDAVIAYVLQLEGVLQEDEKYALPPAFLMEVMELNEAISEYEATKETDMLKQATDTLGELTLAIQERINTLTNEYDRNKTASLLTEIKDYYFRKKYLLRIRERINTFATH